MKSHIIVGATLFTALAFLTSCSSESNTKPSNGLQRPQKLTFSKPAEGIPLTQQQVKEIKNVFSQKPDIEIAPSELLFTDHESKLNTEQARELRWKEHSFQYTANAESYALYKAMRSTCRKQKATLNFDATIPLEKVTSVSDLKTGDHVTTSAVGDYGGPGCDVEASGKVTYGAKVNHLETDGLVSGEASYSLKALMKNPRYAALLKSRGIIASSSVSGVVAKQSVHTEDPTDSELNLKFNINGSYFTVSSEIPVSSTYALYAQPTSSTSSLNQIEIRAQVKMPSFTADVVAHFEGVSYGNGRPYKTITETYYVNGHQKTRLEIQELFGNTFKSERSVEMAETFLN